jgi:hypothetical protein
MSLRADSRHAVDNYEIGHRGKLVSERRRRRRNAQADRRMLFAVRGRNEVAYVAREERPMRARGDEWRGRCRNRNDVGRS